MSGKKNQSTDVQKAKTEYKRVKKEKLPLVEDTAEKFLEKIITHIPEYFGKFGVQLMEYDFSGNEVKNLITESFETGGSAELTKILEDHNFFMVFVDDSLPSNYSLVSGKNWCVWFWNEFDIEEYTFFVIEFPNEFRIYLHETSSPIRLYGKARSLEIGVYKKDEYKEKIFNETVETYMLQVFWSELDKKLECDGSQRFIDEMGEGEFSKDFNTGGYFNFEGINFPKKIKNKAYQKILQNVEDYQKQNKREYQLK